MKTRPDLYVRALHVMTRFEGARRKYRRDRSVDAVQDGTLLVERPALLELLRVRGSVAGWNITAIQTDVRREKDDHVRVPAALVVALFRAAEHHVSRPPAFATDERKSTRRGRRSGDAPCAQGAMNGADTCIWTSTGDCTRHVQELRGAFGAPKVKPQDHPCDIARDLGAVACLAHRNDITCAEHRRVLQETNCGPALRWDRFFSPGAEYSPAQMEHWRSCSVGHGACPAANNFGATRCSWTKRGDCDQHLADLRKARG